MSSILIIEDHMVFAQALQRLLAGQTKIEVVNIVRSGEDALKELPALKVDLVLVDVSLPAMNGIDLVKHIHAEFPDIRCLMLSGHAVQSYVQHALEVGASGYILKDDVDGILEGILLVLAGEIYVSRALRRAE